MFHFRVQLDVFQATWILPFSLKIPGVQVHQCENARDLRAASRLGPLGEDMTELGIREFVDTTFQSATEVAPSNRPEIKLQREYRTSKSYRIKRTKSFKQTPGLKFKVFCLWFCVQFIFISMFLNFMLYLNLHVCVVIVYILRKQELSYLTT